MPMVDPSHSWPSGSVEANGTQLAFHRHGTPGSRPLVVLLHGITDDGLCWRRVATTLGQDFEVLLPDARGHGASGRINAPVTMAQLSGDTAALLDALGISGALIWGHSMGAATALGLAATRPDLVRAMILEDPPLDPQPLSPELLTAIRADASRWPALSADERHAQAARQNPAWDPDETAPWADAKARVDPGLMEHAMDLGSFDWRGLLSSARCPGLLVTGDPALHAIVTPAVADQAMRLWAGGRQLHVPGAGHNIHRDQWAATMEPVQAFLDEVAR
jgi:N-formylmaleamate deformylase